MGKCYYNTNEVEGPDRLLAFTQKWTLVNHVYSNF